MGDFWGTYFPKAKPRIPSGGPDPENLSRKFMESFLQTKTKSWQSDNHQREMDAKQNIIQTSFDLNSDDGQKKFIRQKQKGEL